MRYVPAEIATLSLRGFGEDEAALRTLAAELPHVSVGGPIDNLPSFLGSVDAIVMPSRWEAFGQVALEARMAGRPVIARAIDGLPEQIDTGAGLLTAAEDPVALAETIRLLARAENYAGMCQIARESALDHGARSLAHWRHLLDELPINPTPWRLRLRAGHRDVPAAADSP